MTTSPGSWHHFLFAPSQRGSWVIWQLLGVCFSLRLCCATLQAGPSCLWQQRQAVQVCGEHSRVVSITVHGLPQGESFYRQLQSLWWGFGMRFWANVVDECTAANVLLPLLLFLFTDLIKLFNSQWSYRHLFISLWLLLGFIKDIPLLHMLLLFVFLIRNPWNRVPPQPETVQSACRRPSFLSRLTVVICSVVRPIIKLYLSLWNSVKADTSSWNFHQTCSCGFLFLEQNYRDYISEWIWDWIQNSMNLSQIC